MEGVTARGCLPRGDVCSEGCEEGCTPPLPVVRTTPKNIDRGRNSSCYIALCAKSVGNFTTVTDRQLFGFGNP